MTDHPSLADDEKAALLGLISRYASAFYGAERDRELLKAIQERIDTSQEEVALLHSTFNLFGFNTRASGGFQHLREAVGNAAYVEALNRGRGKLGIEPLQSTPSQLPGLPAPASESLPQLPLGADDTIARAVAADDGQTVRDLVLASLKAAGDTGRKAAQIQAEIEQQRGAQLHPKTTGMTLYRLSQDGLARREGHTWFYVPPEAETKNPGAGTPGNEDLIG